MEIWEALVLGIAQGLSEFLPISSSGHLLILEKAGIGQENLFFNVMLHVGTLFAVLIALRKTWVPLVAQPFLALRPNRKSKASIKKNFEYQDVFGGRTAFENRRLRLACVRADGGVCVFVQAAVPLAFGRQTFGVRLCADVIIVVP